MKQLGSPYFIDVRSSQQISRNSRSNVYDILIPITASGRDFFISNVRPRARVTYNHD